MLAEALARMPHTAAMRLIAAIEEADEARIRCRATDHARPDYPLRFDGVLYAAALVELGAQAAAAHASIFGRGAAHTGLMLAVSDLAIHRGQVESPEPLRMLAELRDQLENAVTYRFAVAQSGAPLVSGELLLSIACR